MRKLFRFQCRRLRLTLTFILLPFFRVYQVVCCKSKSAAHLINDEKT